MRLKAGTPVTWPQIASVCRVNAQVYRYKNIFWVGSYFIRVLQVPKFEKVDFSYIFEVVLKVILAQYPALSKGLGEVFYYTNMFTICASMG